MQFILKTTFHLYFQAEKLNVFSVKLVVDFLTDVVMVLRGLGSTFIPVARLSKIHEGFVRIFEDRSCVL